MAAEASRSAPPVLAIERWVAGWAGSALASLDASQPWTLTARAGPIVRGLVGGLPAGEYDTPADEVWVHRSATIERGAVLKGPLIVGPRCFVASGAYLRGGGWLDADCVLGPGVELKSSFVFGGSRLAHFNFVGDSILGARVNLEAGSIVCNHRNERDDKRIRVRLDGSLRDTGAVKFGALIGDDGCIGANAVLAPGTLLGPASVVRRTALVDAEEEP